MGAPAVVAERLTKRFGAVTALDGLDLEVRPGEVFGYLGPNGAGKTTTIRLLLDLVRPTSGSCSVLGGVPADPAVRARVGYLPGELRIDPRHTTDDVVAFLGGLRGRTDAALVAVLLERFALDPGRPFGELSTGNRRKVGIVQAFMHRPELLLLDEPTSGLDPLLQVEFRDLVRETVAAGATVFLSSHALAEVEALADRVAILRRGRLVLTAGVEELRRTARQRLDLHVAGVADASRFAAIPSVTEARATDGVVHLVVEGPVDPVVKAAAGVEVLRIVSHEADLEDAFLRFYAEDAP